MRVFWIVTLAAILGVAGLQAQNVERMRFQATVSPTNLEPPLRNTDANGDCEVAIQLRRNQNGDPVGGFVDFTCNLGLGMNQQIQAMRIHRGEFGQNGPIVLDSGFDDPVMAGPGPQRLYRQVEVVDTPGLQTLARIMGEPGGYYLNIHSMENPAGFCRDQLRLHDAEHLAELDRQMQRIRETTDRIGEQQGRLMRANSLKP